MFLKTLLKGHFHQLFRSIKFLEQQNKQSLQVDLILSLLEEIDQLQAYISLLIFVDESLPMIRCQRALSELESDLGKLNLIMDEQRTKNLQKLLGIDSNEWMAVLSKEEEKEEVIYRQSTHELLLNTIHATEKIVLDHLQNSEHEMLKLKTLDYFPNRLKMGLEQFERKDFSGLEELICEVEYNFWALKKLGSTSDGAKAENLKSDLADLHEKFKMRSMYLDVLGKMDDMEEIGQKLRCEVKRVETEILASKEHFQELSRKIFKHLSHVLAERSSAPSKSDHLSEPPINLLE